MTKTKLSAPQLALLLATADRPNNIAYPPSTNGRKSVAAVSAWWRTMKSLERRELVRRLRDPRDGCLAAAYKLTDAGRAAADEAR